jgi:hypothetical protein
LENTMVTTTQTQPGTTTSPSSDPTAELPAALTEACQQAAEREYDAECALHAARQSHVDPWIAAAADRLHEAVQAHIAAEAALAHATQ